MRWMEIAWTDLGVKEIAGPEADGRIATYFKSVGRPDVVSDEVPWCAGFAGHCLSRGGVSLAAIPPSRRLLARAYLDIGTPIDEPRVGALCILARTADPSSGHVGFVTRWTATHITLLGGNQSNSVNETAFPRSQIVGLRWPVEAKAPSDLAVDGSRIASAAERQKRDAALVTAATGASAALPSGGPSAGLQRIATEAAETQSAVEMLTRFAEFAASQWKVVLVCVGLFLTMRLAYDAWSVAKARAEDRNKGKTADDSTGEANDIFA